MRKHHRVRVGLFVVISVVTLSAVLLWISGSRLLRPVTHYDVLFESSVTGLLPGSRVEYQGVVVGKVSSIRLTREPPPRGLITLELRGGTPVREDTYATLIGSMVTNIRYVELRGGSKDSPELPPGSVIRAKEGGINDIQDKASELSERVLSIVDQVQTRVLTPENIAAAGVLLKDIAGSAANLRALSGTLAAPRVRTEITGAVSDLASAAGSARRAGETIDGMRGEARETLAQLRKTATATAELAAQVQVLTRHMDGLVAQNRNEMGRLLTNMADTAQQLREVAAVLRDDPSRLVWGSRMPERAVPDR